MMCGIAGIFGGSGRRLRAVRESVRVLRHRGPDGEGYLKAHRAVFGHRRLSIVDIPGSGQPLRNENEQVAVVYNGEIYNHAEIRRSLEQNHQFRTSGDGEVIAHLCEEYSIDDTARRLRGMFAIAVLKDEQLLLARDPLGIKPLYWSRTPDGVVFASEIKAMLPLVRPEDISEFPAGHVWSAEGGLRPYWSLPDREETKSPATIEEADAALIAALDRAVRLRLMADVPVGVFLSGGVDSSMIAALAARARPGIASFAVGTEDSDDLARAREVAALLGTTHSEIVIRRDEVARDISTILHYLESYDVDLVLSAIPTFYLSRFASKRVKVVLSGEGADELFAGYSYLAAYRDHPELLDRELRRLVNRMSSINLQRVDRMTMAFGLEARVPFLDLDVVRHAFGVTDRGKIDATQTKIALRRAAARILPHEIAERPKTVFADGSGATNLLNALFDLPTRDLEATFKEKFFSLFPREIEPLIARWRDERTPIPV